MLAVIEKKTGPEIRIFSLCFFNCPFSIIESLYYTFIAYWISRKRGITPNLSAFQEDVKVKFKTEKYSYENNTERNFQARWQSYIKCILQT